MESSPSLASSEFITRNRSDLLSLITTSNVKAEILRGDSADDLAQAGELIRSGRLVSFPTETVYGLGANALDEAAVRSIFATKKRPLTDPVIVHVDKPEDGLQFIDISEGVRRIYSFLGATFWPGPLTLILRANFSIIPRVVTANTDFVGIRCPNHPIARALIRAANRPIAAPSANLFAHVSPTSAVHVFNDFYDQAIHILDTHNTSEKRFCQFGIESTVVKIEEVTEGDKLTFKLVILRFGSLSEEQLKAAISASEEFKDIITIEKKQRESSVEEHINSEAPGQLLKHYSPYINCYLFHSSSEGQPLQQEEKDVHLEESIIFDYMGESEHLKDKCLNYVSLSEKGDMIEIMAKLYDSLRWAENLTAAKNILIYNIEEHFKQRKTANGSNNNQVGGGEQKNVEFFETVYDKIFRSTSGKKLLLNKHDNRFFKYE